jgi:four helix bundle protein
MAGVRHFKDFVCWQLAYELKAAVWAITRRSPVARDRRFCEQFTDAAAGAPRTIAEGFARKSDPEFAHYLDYARGSLMECQNHLRDAADRRYISTDERDRLIVLAKRAGGAAAALQRYLRRHKRK